jgi:hypothetical protein
MTSWHPDNTARRRLIPAALRGGRRAPYRPAPAAGKIVA